MSLCEAVLLCPRPEGRACRRHRHGCHYKDPNVPAVPTNMSEVMTGINMDDHCVALGKDNMEPEVKNLWKRCDENPTVTDCSPVTGEREVVSDLREGSKRFHH